MPDTQHHHTRTEKLLLEAARRFNATLEYEELIEQILRLVNAAVNSEGALVFRVDHDRTDMKIRYMNCRDCQVNVFHRELGQGVVGWVTEYIEPVIANDVANDPRIDLDLWKHFDTSPHSVISVPLIGKGQMIGVIEAINKLDGEFNDEDLDVLMGLTNQIAVAIDNANLYRQMKREALEKNLLYEVGKNLSSSLSLTEVLKIILDSLLEAVDFDAGGVFIVDAAKGTVDEIYSHGYAPSCEADLHLKMGDGLVGYVARMGEAIIVSNVAQNEHYIGCNPTTKSEMLVPIKLDGRIIGVFNIESNRLNAYDKRDLALMRAFAPQAALSIERARLHQRIINGEKLQQQLKIARDIQKSFLPDKRPQVKGYDIRGRNIPSGEVGGDYYDFIRIVDGQIGVAIGDVSGKGVPAALLMAAFRASLIAEIRNNYSIRTICRKVNRLLFESVEAGNYVTAVYGVLDSKNHVLTFANCGHNWPVLLRASGEVEYLREGGPLLGVTDDAQYEERPVYLDVGDIVALYTDGVTEVFDESDAEFGLERLIGLVRANHDKSATEIQRIVYETVREFARPDFVFDDFTMVVIKRDE